MKKYMIMACMLAATTVFAQKRELRKIEKAIESGELAEAHEIFKTINESEVEDKYKGQYLFYKAASISGMLEENDPSYENLKSAELLVQESMSLGFEEKELIPRLNQSIAGMKIQIANQRLKAGDVDGGLLIIDDIYKADPDNLDILMTSAQLSYQNGDYSSATTKFQTLLDQGYTGQKTEYFAVNKVTGEQEAFPNQRLRDVSVKTAGTHSEPTEETTPSKLGVVVNNLVWLYKTDDNIQKAKFTFEKALERFPDDVSLDMAKPEIYNNLGMMEEYKAAVEELSSSKKDPKVYDNLGAAALKSKNYDQAVDYLSTSLKINPDNYLTQVNLANAYIQKGNLEETTAEEQRKFYGDAVVHLEKAISLKPDDANVKNVLASLYGALGMTEELDALKAKM